MRSRVSWEELVKAAEQVKKDSWGRWAERHGDWGRDAVIYFAVRHGGLRVKEVAARVGMRYQAAVQAARRFEKMLSKDRQRGEMIAKLKRQMSHI
ncbi:MAG TPA: hypothetical protein VFZ59_14010 [Verrucomicrobiae bacterium]|nr:hypothetical protein [Verrucomicrobiae bacterium]